MTNMLVKIAVTPVNTRHVVPTKVLAVQKYHHNLLRIFPPITAFSFLGLPLLSKTFKNKIQNVGFALLT